MQERSARSCPVCHAPVSGDQRFCTNCGTTLSVEANKPTARSEAEATSFQGNNISYPHYVPPSPAASPSGAHFYTRATEGGPLAPPPPPESLAMQQAQYPPSVSPYGTPPAAPSSPATYYGAAPTPGPTPPVPPYARPKKRSRRGAVIGIVLLLVLILGAVGGYFVYVRSKGNPNSVSRNTPTSTPGSGNTPVASTTPGTTSTPVATSTPGGTPGGAVSGSAQLNLKVTYSSIDLTLTSVQQQDSFPDDTRPQQPGVVRIVLNEANQTNSPVFYAYSDIARLILPDGTTSIAPDNVLHNSPPDKATTQTNWIDFPLPSNAQLDLSKLVLRLGMSTENQMNIPLSPNADLSQYQPKTVTLTTKVQYGGIDWTITGVIASLSADEKQATTGNRYITVTMIIDNTTANIFFGGDILRLQSGSTIASPSTSAIPGSIPPHTTNVTGHATFLMPASSTSFVLIFLKMGQFNQVTTNFQIQ